MKQKIWEVILERYIPLLLAAVLAVFGWHKVDNLAAERDRTNRQRDLRIQYLISAYGKLANASGRDPKPGSQYFEDMETAMADIQLFGSDSQIEKAKKTMDKFQETGCGPVNELLTELRDDLRQEMDLSRIEENVQWFRPGGVTTPRPKTKKR